MTLTNELNFFFSFFFFSFNNENEKRGETILMQYITLNNVDFVRFTTKINSSTIVINR
jgi:hypothetical protein